MDVIEKKMVVYALGYAKQIIATQQTLLPIGSPLPPMSCLDDVLTMLETGVKPWESQLS